ncbi:MAG: alpha/beta hydrolase [Anaerocolumna sp.]|jgi:hypothetical protein|nr:alpha/beta hydrolase [Anaerocolumna sp.]
MTILKQFFLPHSISGIYSLYYLNRYDNEVKAFIGIDPTLPRQCEYFNETIPKTLYLLKYLSPLGITRIAVNLSEADFLPITEKDTYSKENLKMTKVLSSWNIYNKNIIWEMNEISNNMEKTIEMKFPSDLPVLIFMKEASKARDDGKTLKSFYKTYTNNLKNQEICVLEGNHYLHWTNSKIMKEKIDIFLTR